MNVLKVSPGWDREKTLAMHSRMKALPDDVKIRFAINWLIPHSIFNTASRLFPGEDFTGVDWFSIHQTRDLGTWGHGGRVYVTGF